jgi:hypothetical protein
MRVVQLDVEAIDRQDFLLSSSLVVEIEATRLNGSLGPVGVPRKSLTFLVGRLPFFAFEKHPRLPKTTTWSGSEGKFGGDRTRCPWCNLDEMGRQRPMEVRGTYFSLHSRTFEVNGTLFVLMYFSRQIDSMHYFASDSHRVSNRTDACWLHFSPVSRTTRNTPLLLSPQDQRLLHVSLDVNRHGMAI